MRYTAQKPMELPMRIYSVTLEGELYDIRGRKEEHLSLYHPSDYSESRAWARKLRDTGAYGIVYDSVRHEGGECAAVFRAKGVLSECQEAKYIKYLWDGERIRVEDTYELRPLFHQVRGCSHN